MALRVEIDDWFAEKQTEKEELMSLTKDLKGYTLTGGRFSFEVFRDWRAAGYTNDALPYPGGRLDQPTWLRKDLSILRTVDRWWDLNKSISEKTKVSPQLGVAQKEFMQRPPVKNDPLSVEVKRRRAQK